MAPSRGRENPRLDKGDAAVLERTAQEQEDDEARRHQEYWEQVWRRLDLPEEEETDETEEILVEELNCNDLEWQQLEYNGWWPEEEAQASG